MISRRGSSWRPWRRGYWPRILGANVVASLVILFVFGGATLSTPVNQLTRGFATAFLFSTCIGPLLGLAMPVVAPRIWAHLSFPFNWIAVAATMAVLAVAGSVLAIGVLIAAGAIPPAAFFSWLRGSIRIAIAITLTFGLIITAYEVMQARVAHATARAQLASLESRVQPHFLFNTLNSIAALIHQDPHGAERMTLQLASLLRSSLDQQATPLVALEDELRVVQDYLAIERVRFGDRLRYTVDVDDAARAARIPRLALQTIIENSVKYAVSPRREGASIAIRAANAPRAVRISVEDDGPGFDAAVLPEGHGLALLRDRLALLFGEHGTLTISPNPNGTRVELNVPHTHDVPAPALRPNADGCDPAASSQQPAPSNQRPATR